MQYICTTSVSGMQLSVVKCTSVEMYLIQITSLSGVGLPDVNSTSGSCMIIPHDWESCGLRLKNLQCAPILQFLVISKKKQARGLQIIVKHCRQVWRNSKTISYKSKNSLTYHHYVPMLKKCNSFWTGISLHLKKKQNSC